MGTHNGTAKEKGNTNLVRLVLYAPTKKKTTHSQNFEKPWAPPSNPPFFVCANTAKQIHVERPIPGKGRP
jgi:hypothetical protein